MLLYSAKQVTQYVSLKIHSLATFGKEDAPSLRFSRKYKNGLVSHINIVHTISFEYLICVRAEKIEKMDLIPSPSPTVKIQIIGGNVYLR